MTSDNGNNGLIPAERPQPGTPGALTRLPERGGYGYGYGYGGAQEQPQGEFNIREYLRVIRKNKWLIATLVVVSTTLVTIAGYRVQNEYVATAMVQVGDENPEMIPGSQPFFVYDVQGKRFNTQLMLLKSPDLVRRVVIETDLEHNPDFFTDKPQSLSEAFRGLFRISSLPRPLKTTPDTLSAPVDPKAPIDPETTARLAPYVGTIIGGLTVGDIEGTQLVQITFAHHDPEVAAKVANAVAEGFIRDDLNQRVGSKASASDFLQERIAELQTEIRAGEERLLNYAKSNEILSLEDDAQNTVVARLASLNKDLLVAEANLRDLESQQQQLKAASSAEDILRLPTAQKDQGAVELSKRRSALLEKRSELSQRYTDEYPAMKQLNEQIAQVEGELMQARARIIANAEGEYQSAVTKVKNLRLEFDASRAATMQQNEAAVSYKMIQQTVETNKKLLEDILQRSKEVDLGAAAVQSPVTLKNRADVPGGPSGPDRSRWVLMAIAGSLFAGIALAFGREYFDQTIRSIEDIDRVVRLPSLGVIPALESGSGRRSRRRQLPSNTGPHGVSTALITALEAKSSAAEAYRQLRTSVLLSSAGHPCKLVLVTSSQPREGKTTTAVNTAISLAQTGASTLIIDCDMRKPRVHQLLNVSNHMGVSLYLSGQNEDLSVLIQSHQIPNLSVMTCGPVPPNPAELLGSDQMRRLLTELSNRYDHVVIDTPPVVSFADPVILSTMVDGVILVVRGGFSSRGIVLRSRQILGEVGAKIYGVVLNDADMKSSDSYYYYSSYYNSYYRKNDEKDAAR
jgi:capsular exopolysaccharide synthesis family protein